MKTHRLFALLLTAGAFALAGCSNDSVAPEVPDTPLAHHYTRADLHPEGDVVETDDGFTVKGALRIDNEDGEQTSFANADLDVSFDDEGRLEDVSGTVQVPPPNDNVSFADPFQADVGFFNGKFLNENRDFPILLEDDTDYFVFHIGVAVSMSVHDDDSDSESEIVVKVPIGGQILMIADYNDPMWFTYGEQDLIGASGNGTSIRGHLPYVPIRPAKDIYSFEGKSIRVGTATVAKLFSVTGTIIEGSSSGLKLYENPIDAELTAGYVYGVNGAMEFSLPVKDVVEFNMPIAEGSAAMRADASSKGNAFAGAFINGLAAPDLDWWPDIVPIKPLASLSVSGNIETTGAFDVKMAGEFGITAFGDPEELAGSFHATAQDLTLTGAVVNGDDTYQIKGVIDSDALTVSVAPPDALLDRISGAVNDELDQSIAEAEQAWQDLQDATDDYEFELSLRGLRPLIPEAMDTAKSQLSKNIAAQLAKHKDEAYYDSLKSFLHSKDDKYYNALNNLKAQAQSTTDSDAWRNAIESALRTAAGYKYFDETYKYKVLGVTVKTVHIKIRILSDSQVSKLTTAADNVKYIAETSDRMIQAQQIYDNIPDKEIFERVKDDIENGVVQIPTMTEFGYVQPLGSSDLSIFAMIDGERREMGTVNIFDLPAMSAAVADVMVDILVEE